MMKNDALSRKHKLYCKAEDEKIKENNRGITLVELMIAIAMSVIILGAAALFMNSSQKGYQMASDTIALQKESQILMEQIGTWIMEGNRVETTGNMLVIYSIPRQVDPNFWPNGTDPAWKDMTAKKRVVWQQGGKL